MAQVTQLAYFGEDEQVDVGNEDWIERANAFLRQGHGGSQITLDSVHFQTMTSEELIFKGVLIEFRADPELLDAWEMKKIGNGEHEQDDFDPGPPF